MPSQRDNGSFSNKTLKVPAVDDPMSRRIGRLVLTSCDAFDSAYPSV
jgi:hypothetical protein